LECPGILVPHFVHYLEDVAILQAQVELRPCHHILGYVYLHVFTEFNTMFLSPLLWIYPKWLNILPFFFVNESLQIQHTTLFSGSSIFQRVQLLTMPLVIVVSNSNQAAMTCKIVPQNNDKYGQMRTSLS
jgi:hypothetical protein